MEDVGEVSVVQRTADSEAGAQGAGPDLSGRDPPDERFGGNEAV